MAISIEKRSAPVKLRSMGLLCLLEDLQSEIERLFPILARAFHARFSARRSQEGANLFLQRVRLRGRDMAAHNLGRSVVRSGLEAEDRRLLAGIIERYVILGMKQP